MARVLAIDPGMTQSGVVVFDPDDTTTPIPWYGVGMNKAILMSIRDGYYQDAHSADHCVIERFAARGRPVGQDSILTVECVGRLTEAAFVLFGSEPTLIFRRDVARTLCGDITCGDAAIRQAIIDYYGPGKDKAIGRKASPGPLYGVKRDVWAALAVGLAYALTKKQETYHELH